MIPIEEELEAHSPSGSAHSVSRACRVFREKWSLLADDALNRIREDLSLLPRGSEWRWIVLAPLFSLYIYFHYYIVPVAGFYSGLGVAGSFLAVFAMNSWLLYLGLRKEGRQILAKMRPDGWRNITKARKEQILNKIEKEISKSKRI